MTKGLFTKYTGQDREVILPMKVQDRELTQIESKAFLSCKTVERLVLPPTVESVGDWGFAHMKNLEEIVLPARTICFGRQAFLGCENLCKVTLYSVKKYEETAEIHILGELSGMDRLRASMFRFFPQESYAWSEEDAEAQVQYQWLNWYDQALCTYLGKPDEEGFVPAFIGWFDVEDVDDQKEGYLLKVRKEKISLVFQRLFLTVEPSEERQVLLYRVLAGYPELVQALLEENAFYGRNIHSYKIWHQSGGLTHDMAERLLCHLPWEEPEIRAFLVECLQEAHAASEEEFFHQLEL